ncbi:S-layer homology domain-containing protein [Cohnella mopanensis]|uniref:S-layer homology domain-containing protein n=1 Tax=Cohnella mopanensis TaxID=2911966 RepID=UPI001EF8083C|nr:S-layer homology domain-containing protein [Cohnella mopanensis]
MKKSKSRLFSILLAFLVAMMSIMPSVSASKLSDSQGHWAQKAIERWNESGVVSGYGGQFRPNDHVTRAEFAMMINNIMKYIEKGSNPFTDVNSSKWYSESIIKLGTAGVLSGEGGKALPDQNITRQEAAVLISKAFGIPDSPSNSSATNFKDNKDIAAWAKQAVAALVSKKVIQGSPDGAFNPLAPLTRAEAVTMFNNFVQELISKPGEYSKDVQGNVVINSAGVILKDMKISGDLYIAQGVGEGEVTLNNVKIEGSVYVRGGGEHSIIFNSVDVNGALVVNKYNGKVRILATGNTSVSVTKLESGALLVTKELTGGGFETVEIPADLVAGQEIVLDGNFNKVVNHSETAQITVNGKIKELVAEVDTNISGKVTIDKVTTASGVSATVNNQPIPSTSGTSSGGGGSGGGGPGTATVSVTGVSINETNVSLVVGQTKQLTSTITPSSAANKTVTWSVADNSTNVVTVSQNGLLTAVGAGTKAIKVVTQDGNKSNQITVQVGKAPFKVALSKFEGAVINQSEALDNAVVTNSGKLSIQGSGSAAGQYHALITATAAMQQTVQPAGHFAYAIITLTDLAGNPITDTTGINASVTGATYSYQPVFGAGIADGYKAGSFILKLDAGNPEAIQHLNWTFTHSNYANTTFAIDYLPAGTAFIKGIQPITGEKNIGSVLTAGNVQYEGTPANNNVSYRWLRSDSADGSYSVIGGATGNTYTITAEDSNKYIRVEVTADQALVGGTAVSAAFGPIQKVLGASEVFAAIEAAYLSGNADRNNVISNLNLVTSLPEFPGVAISWTSNNQAVITNGGVVTRGEKDDQFVSLTVTLSGSITGTQTYELIVRAKGTDNVDIVGFVDPYFVDGYPQAFVKNGKISVRYKLNAPAEVYMVVNSINGLWESSVKAVLEGRAGPDNDIIYVDDWPYSKLESSGVNQLQEFDTGVNLGERTTRVEFVIRDTSRSYTSSAVTTILFDQETVSALDTFPPRANGYFVNDDLSAVYIYYNENIDLTSVPQATDFQLNYGTVNNVVLYNYHDQYGFINSYVKLLVSGIPLQQKNALRLSYTGTAIQDLSDAHNKAETFSDYSLAADDAQIKKVTISSDRNSMIVDILPGLNPSDNKQINLMDASRYMITVAGQNYVPSSVNYSYSVGNLSFKLKFDTPLPAGAASVKVNTSGIVDWSMDSYPGEISSQAITEIGAPGTPTASYAGGIITLTFASGFELGTSSSAVGFVLKVDGVEYALRGFIARTGWPNRNVRLFDLNDKYSSQFKAAIDSGSAIEIKYTKLNGSEFSQPSDSAGALLPDFGYITVTK